MRRPERIPIFLNKLNWHKLAERWNIEESMFDYIRPANEDVAKEVIDYWEQNPDQRFGQVLINLQLLPDSIFIWLDEEHNILESQGINPREFTFWGNNYDKNMNRLPKTKWNLIKDMATDHIEAILDGNWTTGFMKDLFEKELKLRNNETKDNKTI